MLIDLILRYIDRLYIIGISIHFSGKNYIFWIDSGGLESPVKPFADRIFSNEEGLGCHHVAVYVRSHDRAAVIGIINIASHHATLCRITANRADDHIVHLPPKAPSANVSELNNHIGLIGGLGRDIKGDMPIKVSRLSP